MSYGYAAQTSNMVSYVVDQTIDFGERTAEALKYTPTRRSCKITLKNNSSHRVLDLAACWNHDGEWVTRPGDTIQPGESCVFETANSDGLTKGEIWIKIRGTDHALIGRWYVPYDRDNKGEATELQWYFNHKDAGMRCDHFQSPRHLEDDGADVTFQYYEDSSRPGVPDFDIPV